MVMYFRDGDHFLMWARCALSKLGSLSDAEEQALELRLLGRTEMEIAMARGCSVETVRWHTKNILRKTGSGSTRDFGYFPI